VYSNSARAEARIAALLAEVRRQAERGRVAEAVAAQREAAGEARHLAARFPDDLRLRQGLASLLYNLASMLVSTDDMAAAVPELDEALDLYASLSGAVADAGLLCADVRARRGLARAALGRAASAIVDADAAAMTYLAATEGELDHPLGRHVARMVSLNAVVLARHGDPDLAVASADAALMYYANAAGQVPGGVLPAEDGGYVRSAAAVSAMFHLAAGRLAEGYYAAVVIAGNLAPEEMTEPLDTELAQVGSLLERSEEVGRPVPVPVDFGRMLAGALIPVLREKRVLWLPGGEPGPGQEGDGEAGWPGWAIQPTLAAALGRHAARSRAADLLTDLTGGQPPDLVWTPSMRWPGRRLDCGLRLAELAIEVLPRAYADGLRLALDAHALLAAGRRPRDESAAAGPGSYVPVWRLLLTETASACRAAGDHALAEDLTSLDAAIS
jgi:tetratricopeptide (TPR) repeat protein